MSIYPYVRQRRCARLPWLVLLLAAASIAMASAPVAATPPPTSVAVGKATRLGQGDVVLGAATDSLPLHIAVSLKLRNRPQLHAFLKRALDPHTPRGRRTLPPGQFLSQHAPTPDQAERVARFLGRAGFHHVSIASNRLLVAADGTAAEARQAFQTRIARVRTASGASAFANTAPVHVPGALSDIVLAVLGLQDVHRPHVMLRMASTNVQSQHSPLDFPHIYGADNLPTAANVTIGIIAAGDMTPTLADLDAFTSANGLPDVNTEVDTVGNGSSDTSGQDEWSLDSQAIVGMAGGAVGKLVFYTADSMSFVALTEAMNAAVADTTNAPRVINMSFGGCEWNGEIADAENQIFQAAIANGQTFAASSGDSGADCYEDDSHYPFGVSAPASSPYVIAVGGTTLDTTAAGDYAGETAWSGSGGGISTFQPRPYWQTESLSGSRRGVPDIAFDGNPSTGAIIILDGDPYGYGGTSLSSPLFVASWARLLAAHPDLGFAGPHLYALPDDHFNDVTSGSNARPDSGGRYDAGPGYDLVTGRGSPRLAAMGAAVAADGISFPEPYCSVDFSDEVEPITRVAFAQIDHRSSATPDGSPALENFTAISTPVIWGTSYLLRVEGNTNGRFTSVISAYIDWDGDGSFDGDNESYALGSIGGSNGEDGQFVAAPITVPSGGAADGTIRLRITKMWGQAAGPCNQGGYGQAEDYTLLPKPDVIFRNGFDGT
ncbi:MAG TPA: protease pro-enzyme activation domain-containing protein [Rhodanobacteraceae bacterium]|nr:protease pro-enzyme activation domain-containing protein [Rhodanobacteraceae bacterium]